MRPKVFSFTLAGAATTTIYWPVDTHIGSPLTSIEFQISNGGVTSCSAAGTQWPVLGRGTTSAQFVQVTAANAMPFNLIDNNAWSCWRFSVTASGASSFDIVCTQTGSESYG